MIKEYMGEIVKLVVIRHIFAAVCAVFFFFVLPFDLVIRQTLVLLCFAPMSAVAPATQECVEEMKEWQAVRTA